MEIDKKKNISQENTISRELFADMDTGATLSDPIMNIEENEQDEEPVDNNQQ